MQIRTKKRSWFMNIMLVLAPIFSNYKTGFLDINYGDLILILLILVSLLMWIRRKKVIRNCRLLKYFIIYFVVALFQLFFDGKRGGDQFLPNWLRIWTLVYLVDIASQNDFDSNMLRNAVMWVGFVISVILLIQAFADLVLKTPLFPYLPNLPLNYSDGTAQHLIARQLSMRSFGAWRYSSIFFEPANFAQYTLLSLIASLYGDKPFREDLWSKLCAFTITVAILFSQSANGILLLIPIWGIFIFTNRSISRGFNKAAVSILMLMIFTLAIVILSGVIRVAWEDHVMTVFETKHATTGNQRLLQGLAVYSRFDALNKIIGVGYGNLKSYLINHHILTAFNSILGSEYMNGFSMVLVSSGIIGFIYFMWCWMRLYLDNKSMMNMMVFLVISALFCTSNMFYTELTIIYLVFIKAAGKRQFNEAM